MNKLIIIFLLINILFLPSCISLPAGIQTVFPVEPNWQAFTRPPVIENVPGPENQNNFVVSDELVKKTVQQTKYIERVRNWKVVNSVP